MAYVTHQQIHLLVRFSQTSTHADTQMRFSLSFNDHEHDMISLHHRRRKHLSFDKAHI